MIEPAHQHLSIMRQCRTPGLMSSMSHRNRMERTSTKTGYRSRRFADRPQVVVGKRHCEADPS
jgi:hypothetical protein